MKNRLRALRLEKNIPTKDMVATVQTVYPKYDKTIQSKCENGGDYGVTISQAAMDTLYDTFDPDRSTARKSRTADRHRLPCRITCRLTEKDYQALQQLVDDKGYPSMQDWMAAVVQETIKDVKPDGL
ncbi:hypothetical protein RFF05_06580 [Bengtsoniella intestinalis]|uniref:hypothetical protein n=1 Tax=Bengtsoniella intestinalis TaxID=3073143 RepID=UPI00391F350B